MANSAKQLTATGDVTTGPTMLRAITSAGATGNVILRDGGAAGVIKATFDVSAGWTLPIPGGMSFPNGLHATLTTADEVAFWLGDA